ncbi:ATP/GTP-binding protein [Streptomyces sp. NBC_01565]|uniref:ATP/GTP-binding protein n=1 Tax=Streptomyces sp. NBC_01565 TaxID=2975881 RepID=UPI0022582A61|nr:ATP/GTP-binding protein [Streptomyces sp. NBC_01565]MCX4546904.1 ATP/GTP-binding protein [Streptomyces sp. NBC_01565]
MSVCADKPGQDGAYDASHQSKGSNGEGDGPPPRWDCTRTLLSPQPPAGSAAWEGHQVGHGAVYHKECRSTQSVDGYFVITTEWSADPPAVAVDPAVLAQQAVDSMLLTGPKIASPRAEGTYTVGVPMWLWVIPSPTTWGPNQASASAGGITVTATARVASVSWRMGDGSSLTCSGPGTVYTAARGLSASPDCGHRYRSTSAGQPGGKYQGTATTTWTVNWAVTGGGQSGQLTEVRESDFSVSVGELQVVGQ